MNWTLRATVGLISIFAMWCLGWGALILALLHLERNWPAVLPDATWLHRVTLGAPILSYFLAGPFTVALFIRWIRKQSAQEHENRTRQNIANLRRDRDLRAQ